MSELTKIWDGATKFMGAGQVDLTLRKKKIEEQIDEKLKKSVREFSLLHDEVIIYK